MSNSVKTPPVVVKTAAQQADIDVPAEHDIKISSRNYQLMSSCMLDLVGGVEIPDWLISAINTQIATDVFDLDTAITALNLFVNQLELGINQQITSIQTDVLSQNTLLTTNVSRLDDDLAVSFQLIDTKVTPEQASTLSLDVMTSQFNTPLSEANSWFINSSTTMSNAIQASATDLTALTASYNGLSAKMTSFEYVTVSAEGYSLGASKLGTAPDGAITGWEFADGTGIQSTFKIQAENFAISNGLLGSAAYTPFQIVGDEMFFTGTVSFNNIADQNLVNDIAAAQTAANNAQATANNAVSVNNAQANSLYYITDDNYVDKSEKLSLRLIIDQIKKEYPEVINAAASAVDATINSTPISTTAYTNAYNSLITYITNTIAFESQTDTYISSRTTFKSYFDAYYAAEEALRDAITDRLKANVVTLRTTWGDGNDWTKIDGGTITTNSIITATIDVNKGTQTGTDSGGYIARVRNSGVNNVTALKVINPYSDIEAGTNMAMGIHVWLTGSAPIGNYFNAGTGIDNNIYAYGGDTGLDIDAAFHGIKATAASTGGIGVYAETLSANQEWGVDSPDKIRAAAFSPFTGSHISFSDEKIVEGDIVVVEETFSIDVNQSYSNVSSSKVFKDAAVFGVCASIQANDNYLDTDFFINELELIDEIVHEEVRKKRKIKGVKKGLESAITILKSLKYRVTTNSLGEGGINVCDDGGNIEIGDYICSSNTTGKGMKQDDDILHNYTVAKALEPVDWSKETKKTKMIACTYHCG